MLFRAAWLVAASFGAIISVSAAHGQAVHDIHEGAGVSCAACHQQRQDMTVVPNTVCVACHGTMIGEDDPIMLPDPHRSPHLGPNEIPDCRSCHKVHSPSEETCTMCHRGFEFKLK